MADYVDNEKFHNALVEYVDKYRDTKRNGHTLPRVSEYIGNCVLKIGENFARTHKYKQYPFIDEMVGDGILVCISYLHNYNYEKYKNPHAYCTFIIERVFWRRIRREKVYLATKQKMMRDVDLTAYETQEFDADEDFKHVLKEIYQANTVQIDVDKPKKKKKDKKKTATLDDAFGDETQSVESNDFDDINVDDLESI